MKATLMLLAMLAIAIGADPAAAQSRKVVGAPKTEPAAEAPAEDAATPEPVEETVEGGECKDVAFTVRNRTGAPVALISVDYLPERRWVRGPIVSTIVDDGAEYVWTGSFPDTGLRPVRFRVNTRTVLDRVTSRYGGLTSREIRTEACKTGDTYVVALPEVAE